VSKKHIQGMKISGRRITENMEQVANNDIMLLNNTIPQGIQLGMSYQF
jgi:hypothetical protein